MSSQRFTGKTVIITGASSGIGAATAIEFAKNGADLVLGGRNADQLADTRKKCVEAGLRDNQVITVIGDITNESVQHSLVKSAIDKFGHLDTLVNNAGTIFNTPITDFKMEDFDRTVSVNLRSAVSLSMLALPHLIKSKGNVVNVSTVGSSRPIVNSLPYSVSKAGMDMFTKCLAFEVAPQGVRVNSVNPGGVPTNIFREFSEEAGNLDEKMKTMLKLHPLGRMGDVKEIADAILFLASNQATFVTGQILQVCGGAGLGGIAL